MDIERGQALRDLEGLEAIVRRNLRGTFELGLALKEIRDRRLYEEVGYTAFADYCLDRFHVKQAYGYRLAQAAEVGTALLEAGLDSRTLESASPDALAALGPVLEESADALHEAWRELEAEGGAITIQRAERKASGRGPRKRRERKERGQTKKQTRTRRRPPEVAPSVAYEWRRLADLIEERLLPLSVDEISALLLGDALYEAEAVAERCQVWFSSLRQAIAARRATSI